MRRKKLSLHEKVFIVQAYYENHRSCNAVQVEFNKEFKMNTSEAILKLIERIVKRFEKSGSVTEDAFFDSGTIIKLEVGEEEQLIVKEEQPEEIKTEPDLPNFDDDSDPGEEDPPDKDPDWAAEFDSISDIEGPIADEMEDESTKEAAAAKIKRNRGGKFLCDVCSKTFASKKSLIRHGGVHGKVNQPVKKRIRKATTKLVDEKVDCRICGKPLASKKRLYEHEYTHYAKWELPSELCPVCGKLIMGRRYLAIHIRQVHTAPKARHTCPDCGKVLIGKKALVRHQAVHGGSTNFKCLICPKMCYSSQGLEVHMRTHTGERPFKCKFANCDISFTCRSSARVHYRQHTGETPFRCRLCHHSCKQAQNLRSHINHIHKDHPDLQDLLQDTYSKTKHRAGAPDNE